MSKKKTDHYSLDLSSLDKNNLFVNDVKLTSLSKDMQRQLDVIHLSLSIINK